MTKNEVNREIKQALEMARKQLRGATQEQIQEYGLNRYRVANKATEVQEVRKNRKSAKGSN